MKPLPTALTLLLAASPLLADDWPQWRGPGRDGVWTEKGLLGKFPEGGLKVRWRIAVGPGYSSPVIAAGRVYITDVDLGPREKMMARERVLCVDELSGKILWTHAYDVKYPSYAWPPDADPGQGPAPTPVVEDGKLYTVGGMGDLFCLDAASGDVLWQKDLAKAYKVGEFCIRGSPLIEGNLLIIPKGYGEPPGVLAFRKDTGVEAWTALDEGGYNSSPLVVTAGGTRQLIMPSGRNRREVTSLDPASGAILWQEKFSCGIPTPVASKDRVLINGLMLQLATDRPAASMLWLACRDANLSDTTTALLRDDLVLSHKAPDRLVCLEAATGKKLWETDQVKSTTHHLTACETGVLIFTDEGELILARPSAGGYEELSRSPLLKPTSKYGARRVAQAGPAFANRAVFARSDAELVCASLAQEP